GLDYVKILASGNLDEFKIKELVARGVCADSFGVGTNMGTSADAPSLDVIYKISEVTDSRGNFLPTMKLSKGKATYPGRKQVFRVRTKRGRFIKDVLGLEKEKIKGSPLLIKVVDKGRITYRIPSLGRIRKTLDNDLTNFPRALKGLHNEYTYPVHVSKQLNMLRQDLKRQLEKRQ
ncbi:MAG: nicotinate phosphoribosyltransferase, partial [Candidatus Omnitrophota bacterium]